MSTTGIHEPKKILAPDPYPIKPRYTPPPNACDGHCHVFGPAAKFPYAANRSYTPEDAGRERLAALHKHLGFSRAVIVQASCHGTDNSAMMDALAHSNGAWRGVAMVKPESNKHISDIGDGAASVAKQIVGAFTRCDTRSTWHCKNSNVSFHRFANRDHGTTRCT
jgi:hypothetical protein